MDFIFGFPKTRKCFTLILVIIERLTKSAHFILRKTTYLIDKWDQLYLEKIIKLHGEPVFIVSG